MENIFLERKKCFWFFCPKKWLTSAVKKKTNEKKYFFYKNKFGKNFFIKNKLENIFLGKKIWKYVFSLFSREGQLSRGPIIRNPKNTFLGQKFPNIYFFQTFSWNIFFCFFLLQKLVTFWDKNFKNIFFFKKNIFQNCFCIKIFFFIFCPKKWLNSAVKKKKWKKIFLCKNNVGKYLFRKKKCFWIVCPKKWLTSAVKKKTEKKYCFLQKQIWKKLFL